VWPARIGVTLAACGGANRSEPPIDQARHLNSGNSFFYSGQIGENVPNKRSFFVYFVRSPLFDRISQKIEEIFSSISPELPKFAKIKAIFSLIHSAD